jgi:predicted outer membrane repeat protein
MQAAVDAATASGATVHICPGTYHFTAPVVTSREVYFQGEGLTASSVVIDGDGTTRLFSIHAAANFDDLTLREGESIGEEGGAIWSIGTVTVTNTIFEDNYSNMGGGAIGIDETSGAAVWVYSSTFTGNTTDDRGGAIAAYGEVHVYDSLFEDNVSTADSDCVGGGGAIAAGDDVYVDSSEFNGNVAELSTGGCGDVYEDQGGLGGAIATFGFAFIDDTSFNANEAARAGSAIMSLDLAPTTIFHVESVIENGSSFTDNVVTTDVNLGGAIAQFNGGLMVEDATFTGNLGEGGAIDINSADRTVGIYDSTFTDNDGGIRVDAGDLVVDGSTFTRNTSVDHRQGAIIKSYLGSAHVSDSHFEGNGAAYGGAIATGGYLTVDGSSFVNNHATESGGAITGNQMVITNSSFTGNTSPRGGAIWFCDDAEFSGNSFTRNSAPLDPTDPLETGVGGAIGGWADALVTGNTFSANWASRAGGAYWLDQTEHQRSTLQHMTGNRFVRNQAVAAGGAVGYNPESPKLSASELKAWQKRNKFTGNRGGRTPNIGSYVIRY